MPLLSLIRLDQAFLVEDGQEESWGVDGLALEELLKGVGGDGV